MVKAYALLLKKKKKEEKDKKSSVYEDNKKKTFFFEMRRTREQMRTRQARAPDQKAEYAMEAPRLTSPKKFKRVSLAGKVMASFFRDSQGVIIVARLS